MKGEVSVDLSRRATDLEIMDDLNCSGEVVHQTLRELDIINRWLGGNKVTLDAVKEIVLSNPGRAWTIADLGCGGGDILKRIADFGRKNEISMHLTGIDANPHIVEFAKQHCANYSEITFETVDILTEEFSRKKYDIMIGTLFFHHLDDKTLGQVLSSLTRQAGKGLIINDIHRHWLAYQSIRLLTRFFSSSAMVRFDAPLSVRRAFVRQDWVSILKRAGIVRYSLQWKWAFRWKVIIPGQ